jgi:integrase/recombinase XerD
MYSESLQKLLAEFVEAHRVRHMAAATIDGRRRAMEVFFQRLAETGVEDIRAVTRQHVRDHQSWLMSQEKYCIHTVHLHMIGIRRLFEHLENTDAILLNPCVGLRLPKLPDRLPRNVLTLSEVKAVLKQPDTQTARGIRDRALLEMFYSTGLRVGEMAAWCQWAGRPASMRWNISRKCVPNGRRTTARSAPSGWRAFALIGPSPGN